MSDTYQRFRNEVLAGGATRETPAGAESSKWRGLIGIVVMLGLLVLLAVNSIWAFVFVVGLLISIFLHEMGHFLTARRTGMKVTQFFMGMGPRLWSFQRGEVEYGVRAFPIGAFVRIVGMNNMDPVEPGDEDRAYINKSYPRRLLVITAGSLMHMVIAVLLLFGVFAFAGRFEDTGQVHIRQVASGAPAQLAGVRPDDIIVAIDGVPVSDPDDFTRMVRSTSPGSTVVLTIDRDGQQMQLDAILQQNPSVSGAPVGYLGIATTDVALVPQGVLESARLAVTDLLPQAWGSVQGVFTVLNPLNMIEHLGGENDDLSSRPATVVTIAGVSGDIGREDGLAGVLLLLAGVNVFVGVFNMFPLLPFDGGHAAIATYERLRSRPGWRYQADVSKMMPVAMTVMALLVFLLFTGLYLDITKPL